MKFNLKDQTYKGYTLTFKVNSSSFSDVSQIQLRFEKNGKSLCYTKSFSKGTDMQEVYNALMNEVKTVVDYIEYQVECSTNKVMQIVKDQAYQMYQPQEYESEKHSYMLDEEDEDTQEDKVESKVEQKGSLSSWFDNVNTSRYLENK